MRLACLALAVSVCVAAACAQVVDDVRTDRPERLLHLTQTWQRRLVMTSDGGIGLVYWRDHGAASELVLAASGDLGTTWAVPVVLSPYGRRNTDEQGDFGPRAAAALGPGNELYVVYEEDGSGHGVFFQRLDYAGKGVWRPADKKPLVAADDHPMPPSARFGTWPAICVEPGGRVWVFFKSRVGTLRYICEKHSNDQGRTWSPRKILGEFSYRDGRWAEAVLVQGRPMLLYAAPARELAPDRIWSTSLGAIDWSKPEVIPDSQAGQAASACTLADGSVYLTSWLESGSCVMYRRLSGLWSRLPGAASPDWPWSLTGDGRQLLGTAPVGRPRAAGPTIWATPTVPVRRAINRRSAPEARLVAERTFDRIWAKSGERTEDVTNAPKGLNILADKGDQLHIGSRRKFDFVRFIPRDETTLPLLERALEDKAVQPQWEYSCGAEWRPLGGEGLYDFPLEQPGRMPRGLMRFEPPGDWTPASVGDDRPLYYIRITRSGAKKTRPIVFSEISPTPTAFGIETVGQLPANAAIIPTAWTELVGWGRYRVRFHKASQLTFRLAIETGVLADGQVGQPLKLRLVALDRNGQTDVQFGGPVQIACAQSHITIDGPECFAGGSWEGLVTFWKAAADARLAIGSPGDPPLQVASNVFAVKP